MKINKQKKTQKVNKNVILNSKKTKKVKIINKRNGEELLIGGDIKKWWLDFKKDNYFIKKYNYYTNIINMYKNKIEKVKDKLINHSIALRIRIINIFKDIERLINLIVNYSNDEETKKQEKRLKEINKYRNIIWGKLFGVTKGKDRMFQLSNKRDVLNLECPSVAEKFRTTYIECRVRRFRKAEMQFNILIRKFKRYYKEYNALYGSKYTKLLSLINKPNTDIKLSSSNRKKIDKLSKNKDKMNEINKNIEEFKKKTKEFYIQTNKLIKDDYPLFGFTRLQNLVGIKAKEESKTKRYLNLKQSGDKKYEGKDISDLYINSLKKEYGNGIKKITDEKHPDYFNKDNKSKLDYENFIKDKQEVNKLTERFLARFVDNYKRVAIRDLGGLSFSDKTLDNENIKYDKEKYNISNYTKLIKLPIFIEKLLDSYLGYSDISNKIMEEKLDTNLKNEEIKGEMIDLGIIENLDGNNNINTFFSNKSKKGNEKEIVLITSYFYAMIHTNYINNKEDIVEGTYRYILEQLLNIHNMSGNLESVVYKNYDNPDYCIQQSSITQSQSPPPPPYDKIRKGIEENIIKGYDLESIKDDNFKNTIVGILCVLTLFELDVYKRALEADKRELYEIMEGKKFTYPDPSNPQNLPEFEFKKYNNKQEFTKEFGGLLTHWKFIFKSTVHYFIDYEFKSIEEYYNSKKN